MVAQIAVFDLNDFPGFGFEIFIISKAVVIDIFFWVFDLVKIVIIACDAGVDADFLVHISIIPFSGMIR